MSSQKFVNEKLTWNFTDKVTMFVIFFVRLTTFLKFYEDISDCQSDIYDSCHHFNQLIRLLGVFMSKLTTVNGLINMDAKNSELPTQKFALVINSHPGHKNKIIVTIFRFSFFSIFTFFWYHNFWYFSIFSIFQCFGL